mgnify:CR=1 FL=1
MSSEAGSARLTLRRDFGDFGSRAGAFRPLKLEIDRAPISPQGVLQAIERARAEVAG